MYGQRRFLLLLPPTGQYHVLSEYRKLTGCNRLFNFALAFAVPPGLSTIAYKTYFIFGTFNFAACIHIFFCFPETAGRTLEEVEEVFSKGHIFTAWKIDREVGKKTLDDLVHEGKGKATVS